MFDTFRRKLGLEALDLIDVVIAEDLAQAVQDVAERMPSTGTEGFDGFDPHRVGGSVVGKTLSLSDNGSAHMVVLASGAIEAPEPGAALAKTAYLLAHELAHTLYSQLRFAADTKMLASYLPWETGKWLCRYAYEEYLADSLAEGVLSSVGDVSYETGATAPLRSEDLFPNAEEYAELARTALDAVISRIEYYRQGRVSLDEMWVFVQSKTEEILIALAHAQSKADHRPGADALPVTTSERFGPLDHLWSSLHVLFKSSNPLMTPTEFAAAESAVIDEGCSAILSFWREIGLTFKPVNDTFFVSVADPLGVWRGTEWARSACFD